MTNFLFSKVKYIIIEKQSITLFL